MVDIPYSPCAGIEQVIRHHVHYEDMAKRSLGASWGQLSNVARREYVGLFVQLLRDALANRMVEYSGERISYLSEQRERTFAQVKTRLVGSAGRLVPSRSEWWQGRVRLKICFSISIGLRFPDSSR
jgi:ABC-type transporter MlaC component